MYVEKATSLYLSLSFYLNLSKRKFHTFLLCSSADHRKIAKQNDGATKTLLCTYVSCVRRCDLCGTQKTFTHIIHGTFFAATTILFAIFQWNL